MQIVPVTYHSPHHRSPLLATAGQAKGSPGDVAFCSEMCLLGLGGNCLRRGPQGTLFRLGQPTSVLTTGSLVMQRPYTVTQNSRASVYPALFQGQPPCNTSGRSEGGCASWSRVPEPDRARSVPMSALSHLAELHSITVPSATVTCHLPYAYAVPSALPTTLQYQCGVTEPVTGLEGL